MTRSPAREDYRSAHSGTGSFAEGYDDTLFATGTFDSEIWSRERALLDRLVIREGRFLDFACGTGRVLSHLEGRCGESVGLDVSPTMLESARSKVRAAQLVCGDATQEPDVLTGSFDLITAFRFFLNAQPQLRDEAMSYLAGRLRDRTSRLIFNVHGNTLSTRLPVWLNERLHGRPYSQMSFWAVRRLIRLHGLEIRRWYGLGLLDKSLYKRMPRNVWLTAEALLKGIRPLRLFAVYLYFECGLRDDAGSAGAS